MTQNMQLRTGEYMSIPMFTKKKGTPMSTFSEILFGIILFETGVGIQQIISKSQERRISDVRCIFAALIIEHYPAITLSKVGEFINKNHSSVIHAKKRFKNLMDTDPVFKDAYFAIRNKLVGKIEYGY